MGAYGVGPHQISGGPDWVQSDRFEILAKADQPVDDDDVLMAMLRGLLADRFKLALHRETKTMPAFVLEVAKKGPKLERAEAGEAGTNTSSSNTSVTIDAHNSIVGQTSITPQQAERIVAAATRVLAKLSASSQGPFSVGSSFDALNTYTLKDGIGPGGLAVMVVKTENNTASYVTIDGNNMQQGLRDQILQSIRETGVNDAEVMTTDTHLVTGLVRSPLGYYPVGAALPTTTFLAQITQTVRKAMSNLEESSAGFSTFSLQLQVLGSETFQSITGFIGRIARQIGKSFYRLEVATFFIAVVIVFLV